MKGKRMQDQETAGEGGGVTEPTSTAAVTEAEKLAPPDRLTPAQWAERKGIAPKGDPRMPWIEPIAKSTKECPNGIHFHAADVLHGWSHNAYNHQAPEDPDRLTLTEEDFDAALEAAAHYPACNAHMPALAPKAPFRAELEARAKKEAEAAEAAKKDEAK